MIFKETKHNPDLYNTLLTLSRNIFFYKDLEFKDIYETRIYLMFFHYSIILMISKIKGKRPDQNNYNSLFFYIENNLRELGFGDVSVNKKMKDFINLFYYIVEEIEKFDLDNHENQILLLKKYLNINKNLDFYVNYFNKYRLFLSKNTLNNFTKDIINLNF